MDCSELYDEAHTALRTATMLARGSTRKVTKDILVSLLETYMEVRFVLDDLSDIGFVETSGSIVQVLEGCPHKQLVDKVRTDAGPGMLFPLLDPHIKEPSQGGLVDMAERSEGRVHKPPIGGFGYELTRSSTLEDYSYIDSRGIVIDMTSPQTIRRGRIENRIDRSPRRRYRDRPVETWTPADLVGYWEAETLSQLWGRSPDRTNAGALSKVFADLLAENLTPADVRDMIDHFITSVQSSRRKVPSLWKSFIKSKSEIYEKIHNPRSAKFDRTPDGDGDPWS